MAIVIDIGADGYCVLHLYLKQFLHPTSVIWRVSRLTHLSKTSRLFGKRASSHVPCYVESKKVPASQLGVCVVIHLSKSVCEGV